MTFDRREFTDSIEKRHEARRAELMPMVRLVAGAAPVMDKVLRSDDWGRFQTYIQGLIESWRKQGDAAKAKLADPGIWAAEDLLKLKGDVIAAEATVAAFTLAVELPAALVKGAEEAQAVINKFEAKREAAGKAE